jgi:hypothetical protein
MRHGAWRLITSTDRRNRVPRMSIARSSKIAVMAALALSFALLVDAHAARTFPQNSRQVKITDVADDSIIADGDALHLAPGVIIFTSTGATLVKGSLPAPVIARVQLDLNGDVRRIWLLADDEILVRPWWQFWMRSQPQADPTQPVLTN